MINMRIHDGQLPETPLFHVYLQALRGKDAIKVSVQAESNETCRHASDRAVEKAIAQFNLPDSALVAVYHADPVPSVSAKYGAPMGRPSNNLDYDTRDVWKAVKCPLDSGGYDKGGAYWGIRLKGNSLYAVLDGMGNIAYFDAQNAKHALEIAFE